jgi:NADPH-dependent ferric siderophore reductase
MAVRNPLDSKLGKPNVDIFLHRMMGLAALFARPAVRRDRVAHAGAATRTPRWAVTGALWLVLLLVPGSLLLLPALLWWKARPDR